jgi:membrane protease YdiL (CAAX protease family)
VSLSAASENDRFAAELRGFGPVGLGAILVIFLGALVASGWGAALLVLLWTYRSRTPWRELGFAVPRSWLLTIVGGILFGAALKLFHKAIILPLLGLPSVNQAYHYLVGNPSALPEIVLTILVSAAFGEETFYRGYLFERIGKLLGGRPWAKVVAVLVSAALFGVAHLADQGVPGAVQAVFVGLVFGGIFAVTSRLWFLMIAHASFDLTAVAIIYFSLEARVAHWVFK